MPYARHFAVVLLLALVRTEPAQGASEDPWLGRDKALHVSVSFALAASGYAVEAWREDPEEPRPALRWVLALGVALSAGVAKELYDLSGRGDPSWRDLTADAVGATSGALAAHLIGWLVFHDDGPLEGEATQSNGTSVERSRPRFIDPLPSRYTHASN